MRIAILVMAALMVLLLPGVQATGGTPDNYVLKYAVGGLGGGAGTMSVYVGYPTNVPATGTYAVDLTANTDVAAAGVLTFTYAGFSGAGCTVGTLAQDAGATTTSSTAIIPVTTTAAYCQGSVRLNILAGPGGALITAARISFQIATDTLQVNGGLTVTDDANGWSIDLADDSTSDGALTVAGTIQTDTNLTVGNVYQNSTTQQRFQVDLTNVLTDYWFPILFWIAALLFFLYQGWFFAAGFALPGLFDAIWPDSFPLDFNTYFVFCLLGVTLEVAANRFHWGPNWRQKGTVKST